MDEEYNKDILDALREPLENSQQAESRVDDAIMEIERLSEALSLEPCVGQTAGDIYKEGIEVGLPYYPSIAELSAGAVYVACRTTETPRTRGEVAAHSSLPRYTYRYPVHEKGKRTQMRGERQRKVNRSYNLIIKALGIDPPRLSPSDFIQEYCDRLDMNSETTEIALVIAKKMNEDFQSGRSAGALAAGIIDYVTNVTSSGITQKTISDTTCFSVTTIRKRRVEIETDVLNLNS